jgi:hypothetical protein
MRDLHPPRPDARQKRRDRRRPPRQPEQIPAIAAAHRQRATQPLRRQMLHETQKPRQFGGIHALLVQRENEIPLRGLQRVIAVLDPLGDAAERHQRADIIARQKRLAGLVRDFRINRHGR